MGIATFSEKQISYKFRKQVGEITITECRHVKILCTNPSWIWSLSQPNFFYSPTIFSLWAHQGQASCKEVRLSCERQSWSSTQTLAWKRKGPGPINWWIIDQGAHSTLPLWGKQPDILTGCPQSGSLMKEGRSPEKEGIWALHKTNKQLGHLQDQRSTMTPSQECSRLDMQKKEQMGVQIRQPHSNMYTSLKERTHTQHMESHMLIPSGKQHPKCTRDPLQRLAAALGKCYNNPPAANVSCEAMIHMLKKWPTKRQSILMKKLRHEVDDIYGMQTKVESGWNTSRI